MTSAIKSITLHYPDGIKPAAMAGEQDRAIADLCAGGQLAFHQDNHPPYHIDLSIYNRQLVFKATGDDGHERPHLMLSLSPYRSIIKDYFMMIESYEQARMDGQQQKLEPIDMARRGLHNEAADLMIDRLKDKIDMDFETARRLFTLICVLHMDQARLWQG
jgi:uncharacterized protein (UPF0262 family)